MAKIEAEVDRFGDRKSVTALLSSAVLWRKRYSVFVYERVDAVSRAFLPVARFVTLCSFCWAKDVGDGLDR